MSILKSAQAVAFNAVSNSAINCDTDGMHREVVSDVSFKFAVRRAWEAAGHRCLIAPGENLQQTVKQIISELSLTAGGKKSRLDYDQQKKVRDEVCRRFKDSMFGNVLQGGPNLSCGHIQGPVQVSNGEFVREPEIFCESRTCSAIVDGDAEKVNGQGIGPSRSGILGYNLCKHVISVSKYLADKVGTTENDLDDLWLAIQNAPDAVRSAAKSYDFGGLGVFRYVNTKQPIFRQDLIKLITVDVASKSPKSFDDFTIKFNKSACPKEVEFTLFPGCVKFEVI